jgi:hypothetical protein
MEHVNAEILRAIADGKKVQYRHASSGKDWTLRGPWEDFDGKDVEACWSLLASGPCIKWRIAPETIKIGEHEVPEPCRVTPEVGFKFWVLTPFGGATYFTWDGTKPCYDALEGGFVHLTKEAAEQHYEAIKSLLAKT